jgi:hypothetical protein
MAVTMNGKISNAGNLRILDGLFRNQTVGYTNIYLGFIEGATPLDDTSTLAGIDECEGVSRTNVTSDFGTAAALDSGVPEISNDSEISTANASAAESLTGWFITDAASGTSGSILAYGNVSSGSLNTNVGSPVTIASGALVINND